MRKRQLKKLGLHKKVSKFQSLKDFVNEFSADFDVRVNPVVSFRSASWVRELTTKHARQLKSFLDEKGIRYEDRSIHGETHCVEFKYEGIQFDFWYERKFTKEDKINKLKAELAELEGGK